MRVHTNAEPAKIDGRILVWLLKEEGSGWKEMTLLSMKKHWWTWIYQTIPGGRVKYRT
jgi:hypothetical protein